jgi:hypothetical protein
VTEINLTLGMPPSLARARARLGVALTRGLLLDLLATRDVESVDAAMRAFIDVYEAWPGLSPGSLEAPRRGR